MTNEKYQNPGIAHILLQKKVKELEALIESKDIVIARQEREINTLLQGLNILGWWCLSCDSFNGEEHSLREVCRCCDAPKPRSEAEKLVPYLRNAHNAAVALKKRMSSP